MQRIDDEMTENSQPKGISELEPSMTDNAIGYLTPALSFCSSAGGKESEEKRIIFPSSHRISELKFPTSTQSHTLFSFVASASIMIKSGR